MTLSSLVNPSILSQPVYEPGKPIEDVARELGLDPACEWALRGEQPLATGLLTVQTVLPGGPAAGLLDPGDMVRSRRARVCQHYTLRGR